PPPECPQAVYRHLRHGCDDRCGRSARSSPMQTRPITRKSRLAGRAAVGVAVVAGMVVPAAAMAHPSRVTRLTSASGPSLFAAGCPGALHDEAKTTGLVIEPA